MTTNNTNVETITSATAAAGAEVIQSTSKSKVAQAIFAEMFAMEPRPARKDMINRAKAEAGLTDAGAATYLQNYKRTHGLVASKKEAAPAA